jgi:hypothetical protein
MLSKVTLYSTDKHINVVGTEIRDVSREFGLMEAGAYKVQR